MPKEKEITFEHNPEKPEFFDPDLGSINTNELEELEEDESEEDDLNPEDFEPSQVQDVMSSFLKSIGTYPVFTPEEELHYGQMLKGTPEEQEIAKEAFITHNLRLVVSVARKYSGYSLPMEDIVQNGTLGLIKAVERYDVNTGRFSTYATWWIRQAISRGIQDTSRNIRIPVHYYEKIQRMRRARHQLEMNGVDPTVENLAQAMQCKKEEILRLLQVEQDTVSMNQRVGDGDDTELSEFMESPELSPEDQYLEKERREIVSMLMECLTQRERFVIQERFGLVDNVPKTLEELGVQLGITRERVRQIEKRAMLKMKHPARRRLIGQYEVD